MDNLDIDQIVQEVVRRIREEVNSSGQVNISMPESSDLVSIVARARAAQEKYQAMGLEARKRAVEEMRKIALYYAEELGNDAVSETGFGKMPDKKEKVILAATKTPGVEDIVPKTYTGDNGLTLEELAPYGVVLSITPSTNPPSTIVNNSISIVAAGNAVIFQPHPSAKDVSIKTAELMRKALISVNVPIDVIQCVPEPTIESANELMHHSDIDIVVVTGGMGVVDAALNCGKKSICAGPGNPPVIVDETADISKAARDIVAGASFDNGVLCTAEKEIFVVETVADELIRQMRTAGAVQLSPADADKITKLVIKQDDGSGERHPVINKEFVGKNAPVIARAAGIDVGDSAPLIFFETLWDHPLVMAEQLMPVMPVVRVPDVDEAMRLAIIAEHRFKHSFIMHSKNVERLSKMARMCDCNIFVKNGPSYSGLGYNGEGYTTLTIAGTTGDGLVSAKTFTRPRRCVLVDYFRIV
ncbi:aldehyde dehydrogenase EutE [bacterium]|nr:aldehyde dehydrogenase EutE [bacterium]